MTWRARLLVCRQPCCLAALVRVGFSCVPGILAKALFSRLRLTYLKYFEICVCLTRSFAFVGLPWARRRQGRFSLWLRRGPGWLGLVSSWRVVRMRAGWSLPWAACKRAAVAGLFCTCAGAFSRVAGFCLQRVGSSKFCRRNEFKPSAANVFRGTSSPHRFLICSKGCLLVPRPTFAPSLLLAVLGVRILTLRAP